MDPASISSFTPSAEYVHCDIVLRISRILIVDSAAILRYIRPKRSSETRKAIMQDLRFDCRVAQVSIFIDISAYVLTLISPTSAQVLFICFTSLSSFTSGANPAIHALAVSYLLAFHNDQNVGRMFGGMSMLQAVSNTLQVMSFTCWILSMVLMHYFSYSRYSLDSYTARRRVHFQRLSLLWLLHCSLRHRCYLCF